MTKVITMKNSKKKKTKQNIFIYRIVQLLAHFFAVFVFKRKFMRNEIKNKKGPFVIIANHEAALDFVNLIGATKTPLTFVISNSFYNTLPMKGIVSRLGMIPKQQFQTSLKDLSAMKNTIKDGKVLVIYPAGLMCEDGLSTPIPAATYEFLQWLDADVYVAKTIGTYFAMPKWAKKGLRKGRTYIDIYKLFDKNELHELSLDEIKEKTSESLDFDAYLEQEKLRIKYKDNDNIEGLENVLYECPHCHSEFTIQTKGKTYICCSKCGFEEHCDKYGFLHNENNVGKEIRHVSDWSKMIYDNLKSKVLNGEIPPMSVSAKVQVIDPKKRKYRDAGKAYIVLSREHITFQGEINGEYIDLILPTQKYPSLPFKPGKNFEIQHGDISYRCFPENPIVVMKWINLIKIYYELQIE